MNKEVIKTNLKNVFDKEKELEKARKLYLDANMLREKTENKLRDARGFLRESIEDIKEIYLANINGQDYKIKPYEDDQHDVSIEEITIIK